MNVDAFYVYLFYPYEIVKVPFGSSHHFDWDSLKAGPFRSEFWIKTKREKMFSRFSSIIKKREEGRAARPPRKVSGEPSEMGGERCAVRRDTKKGTRPPGWGL